MIFVEKRFFMRKILHKKRLKSHVAIMGRGQADSADNAACIGIDNEAGFMGGIENHRICSLFPHTING